jgi:DNA-binding winged helix-turn-helix (wHTH) protein
MKSFQVFRLDTANQCLWRGQERVAIPPKPYDMPRYLVENPGRLVTQDEFLEKLWPETYINPELIRKYILDIRKILGDRPNEPEFIETVTKRGYRFIAQVVAAPPSRQT